MRNGLGDAASTVLSTHLLGCITGYRANMELALEMAENGWLPSETDERGEVLDRHLAAAGHSGVDGFLLRVGLTVPGIQRGIRPPLLVLNEGRGGLSTPRLAEAQGQVVRLTEALAVGRYWKPNLSHSPREALAELTTLTSRRPAQSTRSLQIDLYCQMSTFEASELASVALDLVNDRKKELRRIGRDIVQRIACFRHQPLDSAVTTTLAQQRVFWPASLYRDADESVASVLLKILDGSPDAGSVNHLLLALAWTRSSVARDAFVSW